MEGSGRYTAQEIQRLEGKELSQLAVGVGVFVGPGDPDDVLRPKVFKALQERGLLMQNNGPSENKPPAEVQQRHRERAVTKVAQWRGEMGPQESMSVPALAQELADAEREGHDRARVIIQSLETRNKELAEQNEHLNRQIREERIENEKMRELTHAASKAAKEEVQRCMQHGFQEAASVNPKLSLLVCGDCKQSLVEHVVDLSEGCALRCRRDV